MKTADHRAVLKGSRRKQAGVTSIEYALLAALIFGAIVITVGNLGTSVDALYDDVALKVADALL
jgi:pilus assembly protein Flp/PilA